MRWQHGRTTWSSLVMQLACVWSCIWPQTPIESHKHLDNSWHVFCLWYLVATTIQMLTCCASPRWSLKFQSRQDLMAYGNMFLINAYVKPFALLTKPRQSLTTWWNLCQPNAKHVKGNLENWKNSSYSSCGCSLLHVDIDWWIDR